MVTDFPGENAYSTSGGVITKRTGTASADTVPIGSVVLWTNTGAGSHTVTLGNSQVADGLAVSGRVLTIAAGTNQAGLINPLWGDANGRVSVAINGTPGEVLYYVMSGF